MAGRLIAAGIVLCAVPVFLAQANAQDEALERVSVRMDWVFSGYHAPFFVGVENGYYREEGLDVTVEPGNGSGTVAQAIGNGNGDFAAVDGGTMMNLVSKGLEVKAIMGILQRSPLSVVYNVESGISEPSDLAGKSIGVTSGEAPLILLPAFLQSAGVEESSISLVNADAASKDAIMLSGQVDAVLNFNFLAIPPLEDAGMDVDTLNYADYGVNVPGLSLIASTRYLDQNPETVEKFVRATVKAYEWTRDNPEEAIDILIEATPGQRIRKETALQVLTLSFDLLHSEATQGQSLGVMAEEDWAQAEELLARYQDLEKMDGVDVYFTNQFVRPE